MITVISLSFYGLWNSSFYVTDILQPTAALNISLLKLSSPDRFRNYRIFLCEWFWDRQDWPTHWIDCFARNYQSYFWISDCPFSCGASTFTPTETIQQAIHAIVNIIRELWHQYNITYVIMTFCFNVRPNHRLKTLNSLDVFLICQSFHMFFITSQNLWCGATQVLLDLNRKIMSDRGF